MKSDESGEGSDPVNVVSGFKKESAKDLVARLNGTDFSLVRSYSSDPDLDLDDGWLGNNWQLLNIQYLHSNSLAMPSSRVWLQSDLDTGGDLPGLLMLVSPNDSAVSYWLEDHMVGLKAVYTLPDTDDARIELRSTGPSPTDPLEIVLIVDGESEVTFRNAVSDKYVDSLDYIDGGFIQFSYGTVGGEIRPLGVSLNGQRSIDFTWSETADVTGPGYTLSGATGSAFVGKLLRAELFDTTTTPAARIGRTDYTYALTDSSTGFLAAFTLGRTRVPILADVGSAGDLIQVTQYTPMHLPVGSPDEYIRVTQYRYHDGITRFYGSPTTMQVSGDDGALKAVLPPANIEAALFASGYDPTMTDFVSEAESILAAPDSGGTGIQPIDVASKLASYDTGGLIETQYVRAGCGCGGGGGSAEEEFTRRSYARQPEWTSDDNEPGISVHVTEAVYDSGSWQDERRFIFDYVRLSLSDNGAPYLINSVVEDVDHPGTYWVTRREYNVSRLVEFMAYPSTTASYTPSASGAAPVWTSVTEGGLVEYRRYNAEKRLVARHIGDRMPDTVAEAISGFAKLEERDRVTGRSWLVSAVRRYRSETLTSGANDIETTSFTYGFHNGTENVAWTKTTVEAELDNVENGPSGSANTYSSFEMFDIAGNTVWRLSADGEVDYRGYDSATGALIRSTRLDALPSSGGGSGAYPAFNAGNFASVPVPSGDIGTPSDSLTTEYTRDSLGRMTAMTDSIGRTTYVLHGLRADPEALDTIPRRATLRFPAHIDDADAFDGPLVVSFRDAAGRSLGSDEFAMEESAGAYNPLAGTYVEGDLLARQRNDRAIGGRLQTSRVWQDVSEVIPPSVTSYGYDPLGRITSVTTPNGTVRTSTHDVRDRVTSESVGIDLANQTLVREYLYDGATSISTPAAGNGYLTLVREHVDGLPANIRETEFIYDYRGRQRVRKGAEPPYEYTAFDNLNRPTTRILFEDEASSLVWPTGGSFDDTWIPDANRGLYETTVYGQRGFPVRTEVAIDPTDLTGSGFLRSDTWYDAHGHVIASTQPSGPAMEYRYDGLGRRITTDVVAEAPGAGVADDHADALDATGDTVLESSQTVYELQTGLVEYSATLMLPHDEALLQGALDGTNAVGQYMRYGYDDAGRIVATIDLGSGTALYGPRGAGPLADPLTSTDWSDPVSVASAITAAGMATDYLLTVTGYDERGLVSTMSRPFDGGAQVTAYFYDDASQRIAIVENAQGDIERADIQWLQGTGSQPDRWTVTDGLDPLAPDENRVTSFAYDRGGNVVVQVAHVPATGGNEDVQATEYRYGVRTTTASGRPLASEVNSNDILVAVNYPNESSGDPDASDAYRVDYAYNRLGELVESRDQNGTVHAYARDGAGRVTSDDVTTFGTGIDNHIGALEYDYDEFGRLREARSIEQSGSATANSVRFGYSPLWQPTTLEQDVDSGIDAVGGIATETVEYTYENAASANGNHSRLSGLIYPSQTMPTVTMWYGDSGSVNQQISRVQAIRGETSLDWVAADAGDSHRHNALVAYKYLGLSTPVQVLYPIPGMKIDHHQDIEGATVAGTYPMLDRFGRVARHRWVNDQFTVHPTSPGNGHANGAPLFDQVHSYDRLSNRLSRLDGRYKANREGRDRWFEYDGLNRLKSAFQGEHDTGGSHTSTGGSQFWDLDTLGNWSRFEEDRDTDSDPSTLDQDLWFVDHNTNAANEIESIDTEATKPNPPFPGTVTQHTLAYDAAGNMTDPGGATAYQYDAWNRLVKATNASTPIGEYEYNALHWRTRRRADLSTSAYDGIDHEYRYYYSASWQLLEEHVDNDLDDALDPGYGVLDRIGQQVWGLRYIDDAVARRVVRDGDEDGDFAAPEASNEHIRYMTDALFSVVGVCRPGEFGTPYYRIDYSAYGVAKRRFTADFVAPFDQVDMSDANAWFAYYSGMNTTIDGVNFDPDYEMAPDHEFTSDDTDAFSTLWSSASFEAGVLPEGWIDDPNYEDGVGNPIGYAGYIFASELSTYISRYRLYSPQLGRWLTCDPIGNIDGAHRYQYVSSNSESNIDPSGLTPQLWTGSGINNWDGLSCTDYVSQQMNLSPNLSFISQVGTNPEYRPGGAAAAAGGKFAKGLGSEQVLDFEAETLASTRKQGEFCREDCEPTRITMLLIAPKTTTKPQIDTDCCDVSVNVYFSPWDRVPNQSGIGPGDSQFARCWREVAINGFVQGINTNFTPGYIGTGGYPHHNLGAFLSPSGRLRRSPDLAWVPDASSQLASAMASGSDYVLVGHSQGTNILLHVLNQVCNRNGIGIGNDGHPN